MITRHEEMIYETDSLCDEDESSLRTTGQFWNVWSEDVDKKGKGSCDTYDKHSTTQDDYKHAGCYLWLLTTSNTHIPHNQISVAYLIKYNQINGKIIL